MGFINYSYYNNVFKAGIYLLQRQYYNFLTKVTKKHLEPGYLNLQSNDITWLIK